MLQTARPKDLVRARLLAEQAELDTAYLLKLLRRHGLTRNWRELKGRAR